ncbi:MAG: lysine--tRNA ligase, partial [Oscillospiraceae bacterium]|nr:lysine--tRNA ligase [Oscillospiraceae bacterium]
MIANGEELSEILQVRREKLARLQSGGRDPFKETRFERSAYAREIKDGFDAFENKDVAVAGRMMSKRDMGKAFFCDLMDVSGRIQMYVRIDDLGEEAFEEFKKFDIGDIIGAEGFVFRTRRGEISVHCRTIRLLSKSLRPLPEKFHGLKDEETRYRRRYLDLIVNPEVKRTFEIRAGLIKSVRSILDALGYLEVETPVLNTISGGANARPFITHHNALNVDMYMRIATELHLKRLIVGGLERVYEIGRIFRNEGMDTKHNPEFTTVEFYEAYADMNVMMERTEQIISSAARDYVGTMKISYQGTELNLTPPFDRMTMAQAVKKFTGVDFDSFSSDADAKKAAASIGIEIKDGDSWGDLLYRCFDEKVEDKLIQPVFITMHPVEVSPLAKRSAADERLTERFELFIYGREMANAFSELNDPIDQKARFQRQMDLRAAGDEEAGMMDEDYICALEYGMPPTGGCGIGIDRVTMLLADCPSIRDVILFPTMKPLDMPKKEDKAETKVEESVTNCGGIQMEPLPDIIPPDFSNVVIEPLFQDQVDFETFSKSDFRAVKVLDCQAVQKSKKLLQFTLDDGSGENRTILSGIHAYYEPEQLIGKTCIAITNLPPRAMMGIESCGMLLSAVHKEGEEEKLHLLMVDP